MKENKSSMREKIHSFIATNFVFDQRKTIGDDESLLGSGVIDSTGVLELISYLEQEFSITFEDDELIGENFGSISKIVALVDRKTHAQ